MKVFLISGACGDGSLVRRKMTVMAMIDKLEKLLASDKDLEEVFAFELDDKYDAYMVDVSGCEKTAPASMEVADVGTKS